MPMKSPWLVQRCISETNSLEYEYTGSTEFNEGRQSQSLTRIFTAGISSGEADIFLEYKLIPVFMLASNGFPFASYQQYLQRLAENKLRMQESARFDDAVKRRAGIPRDSRWSPRTNAWFDFENDVLWVLTEAERQQLLSTLQRIKKNWSERK